MLIYHVPQGTFIQFNFGEGRQLKHATTRPFYFDDGDVAERGANSLVFQYGWQQLRVLHRNLRCVECYNVDLLAVVEDVDELLALVPCVYRDEMETLWLVWEAILDRRYSDAYTFLDAIANRLEFTKGAQDAVYLIKNSRKMT